LLLLASITATTTTTTMAVQCLFTSIVWLREEIAVNCHEGRKTRNTMLNICCSLFLNFPSTSNYSSWPALEAMQPPQTQTFSPCVGD
jgi:hypothetical protein